MQTNTGTDVLERFFRYVQVSTESSDEHADRVPSTPCQFDLANLLADELRELGARDVSVSDHAYVTAHIPASSGAEDAPRLGLIAHLDTTEAAPGAGVRPHIVSYAGGDLVCGEVDGRPVSISPEKEPALDELVGEDLVCTDGTTLLGADDKAGVAEIMSLVALLAADPSIPHPPLGICFCPDEEIGHGAALLDLASFGCAYAYTVDGGPVGELEWECFNAAEATVSFEGFSIHPGDAKDRMVNAANLLVDYQGLLPAAQRPEHTAGYEGFMHLMSVSGTVTHATARYIVRDHDAAKFERKLELMRAAADFLNTRLGEERVHVEFKREYRNMAEVVGDHPELIERAEQAFSAAGVVPKVIPIRGGTDGAQLSFRGLPCPNLSTGAYCCHGVNEFIPVSSLEKMVDVLVELVGRFA
ncbi:peptidase T [Candidatus Collinsella stercoripullorum]|uniref:peptidase T n=1 Tax=Candidatus Collinsella stercoripullorum TaxID=2838522 RepID=UPI001C3A1258|nr:peptidase T [Candidatus Collinsella stercoripullorum]HJA01063.1 peptidase T [Candidatus Collinsella stercoripullorum]